VEISPNDGLISYWVPSTQAPKSCSRYCWNRFEDDLIVGSGTYAGQSARWSGMGPPQGALALRPRRPAPSPIQTGGSAGKLRGVDQGLTASDKEVVAPQPCGTGGADEGRAVAESWDAM